MRDSCHAVARVTHVGLGPAWLLAEGRGWTEVRSVGGPAAGAAMGVTIVLRLWAQDGQRDEILAMATREFEAPTSGSEGCRYARLFQTLGDPDQFLYVAEWDSREAFERGGRQLRTPALDALMLRFEGPHYCRELYSYENMARRPEIVACAIGEAPAAAADATRELAIQLGREASQAPGLVLYRVAEDVARAGRIVVLHGWDSLAALELARGDAGAPVQERLRALGVAVTVSVGRTRATFDRLALP